MYHNAKVAWELYGPGEEDYLFLRPDNLKPRVREIAGADEIEATVRLRRPGSYRLRAATVDTAGAPGLFGGALACKLIQTPIGFAYTNLSRAASMSLALSAFDDKRAHRCGSAASSHNRRNARSGRHAANRWKAHVCPRALSNAEAHRRHTCCGGRRLPRDPCGR